MIFMILNKINGFQELIIPFEKLMRHYYFFKYIENYKVYIF
jgi:hypothetical protein